MAAFASPPRSAGRHRNSSSATNGFVTARPKSSGALSFSNLTRSSEDDSKTAVKVAIRLRPPIPPSDPAYDLVPARFRSSSCQVSNNSTLSVDSPQGKKLFVFDRVFTDHESQEDVWDYVSPGVDSFVQGYNVSLLAYGQSGAGKSYTMGTSQPGEQQEPGAMGIIPRAAAALFELLPAAPSKANGTGIKLPTRYSSPVTVAGINPYEKPWQLTATYVELRDLLVDDTIPSADRPNVTIREDSKGRIILTGLQQVPINSIDDLMSALHFGSTLRQTDATDINAKSSRSHAVFSLNLVHKKARLDKRMSVASEAFAAESVVTVDSKLHFVDLAGSERLKNSGLKGERVKEGISINAGLASLGKVISQLSSKASSHVSYRDSRLTRLLQDSLGGNAITYMVACVNPVQFHLSETLNTVQYAQRARAIQTRPQIQSRSDDGDKQLIIDRLRAEVKFLREQIRLSAVSDRRKTGAQDKSRYNERESELQNQLLDIQMNYSALSQRHARLVSGLANGNEDMDRAPVLKGALEYTARNRLHRSTSFAEQVEQVILEYEKTIQNLETSLSTSRSSLSTSENKLLQREGDLVYLEALTQQLQTRISRAMDRESNDEAYLRDLESKLDAVHDTDDKQHVVIGELKKEIARARESEASAEEYISTLEERLAEAEQDTENMHRDIARLESVIERQRSIGKLDNLLSELDTLGEDDGPAPARAVLDVHATDMFHDRLVATATASTNQNGDDGQSDLAEDEWKSFGPMDDVTSHGSDYASATRTPGPGDKVHSPAQARAIADKLETMTMELFELRGDHESTLAELDDVSRKYQIALSTLAELQDAVSGARPQHFLASAPVNDASDDAPPSRVLSSEISSLGESPTLVDGGSDAGTPYSEPALVGRVLLKEETLAESIRALKRANAEKDISINELTENYAQLEDQHRDTLKYIEELKEEAQRAAATAAANSPTSPSTPSTPQISRRRSHKVLNGSKSMSNGFSNNREGRVFASFQNFIVEHLQGRPDAIKSFESNLHAAMTESQLRQEKLEAQEAELASARRDLQQKSAMISGLHRERTTWAAMPAAGPATSPTIPEAAATTSPADDFEAERARHAQHVASLEAEIANHKLKAKEHDERVQSLEASFDKLVKDSQADDKARAPASPAQTDDHRELVASLEDQIEQQKSLVLFHQQGQKAATESHAKELDNARAALAAHQADSAAALQAALDSHSSATATLSNDLASAQADLQALLQSLAVVGDPATAADPARLRGRLEALAANEKLAEQHAAAATSLAAVEGELAAARNAAAELQPRIDELSTLNDETMVQLEKSIAKENQSARMVQELEEQLSALFEQHKTASDRLAAVSKERADAERDLEDARKRVSQVEGQLHDMKRMTTSSQYTVRDPARDSDSLHLRKSPSHTSLPAASPPPTGPLPPLPSPRLFGPGVSAFGGAGVVPTSAPTPGADAAAAASAAAVAELETRTRTLEKKLATEKQLTNTLEQALLELENLNNRTSAEAESWRLKATHFEDELGGLRNERGRMRNSIMQLQEETVRRKTAEDAQRRLEEQMTVLAANDRGKKKKNALNCF